MTAATNRTRLLGRLHGLARAQGMDEETYRAKLKVITGKDTATALTNAELELACQRFRPGAHGAVSARLPAGPTSRLIQALWISLHNLGLVRDGSDEALMSFIRRQTKLDAAAWLKSPSDVNRVVEALKDWLARDGGVDWTHRPDDPTYMRLAAWKVAAAQWRKLMALGAVTPGRTWTGRESRWIEDLAAYAMTVKAGEGPPSTWTSPQWAKVSKALGRKLRAAMEKGAAA